MLESASLPKAVSGACKIQPGLMAASAIDCLLKETAAKSSSQSDGM